MSPIPAGSSQPATGPGTSASAPAGHGTRFEASSAYAYAYRFFSPVPEAHMAGEPPALFAFDGTWDHRFMSVKRDRDAPLPATDSPVERRPEHGIYAGRPATQVLRTVGRRRHDAEAKLEQHLEEARHKNEPHE